MYTGFKRMQKTRRGDSKITKMKALFRFPGKNPISKAPEHSRTTGQKVIPVTESFVCLSKDIEIEIKSGCSWILCY